MAATGMGALAVRCGLRGAARFGSGRLIAGATLLFGVSLLALAASTALWVAIPVLLCRRLWDDHRHGGLQHTLAVTRPGPFARTRDEPLPPLFFLGMRPSAASCRRPRRTPRHATHPSLPGELARFSGHFVFGGHCPASGAMCWSKGLLPPEELVPH